MNMKVTTALFYSAMQHLNKTTTKVTEGWQNQRNQ